jgi:hypothetical protein
MLPTPARYRVLLQANLGRHAALAHPLPLSVPRPRPTATRVPIDARTQDRAVETREHIAPSPPLPSMKTPQTPAEYRKQAERARRLADVVPNAEMRRQLLGWLAGTKSLPRAARRLPETEDGKATVACGLPKRRPRFGRILLLLKMSIASPSGSRGHVEQLRGEPWLNRGGLA